jgi:hypothetical protein
MLFLTAKPMPRQPEHGLYPGMLGTEWNSLAAPLRLLHAPGGKKCGRFRVDSATSRTGRLLAKWFGLPRPAANAQVLLQITPEGGGERWERSFDGRPFVTRQFRGAKECLVERVGAWELRFRLRVENGALRYIQQSARLCLGIVRLRFPLGPRVSAVERADGPNRVTASVSVRLPLIGQLIAYEGWLETEEPAGS